MKRKGTAYFVRGPKRFAAPKIKRKGTAYFVRGS